MCHLGTNGSANHRDREQDRAQKESTGFENANLPVKNWHLADWDHDACASVMFDDLMLASYLREHAMSCYTDNLRQLKCPVSCCRQVTLVWCGVVELRSLSAFGCGYKVHAGVKQHVAMNV